MTKCSYRRRSALLIQRGAGRVLLSLFLLFVGACVPLAPPVPTYTPAPTLTPTLTSSPLPTPTLTKTSTPTPRPTSTPTPAPTVAPAAVMTPVAKVIARLAAMGVKPFCLRWEDTDVDGESEWLGLYVRPGEPFQLTAFILDGEIWYDLEPLKKEPGEKDYGLGEYPTCEVEVRDTNADGLVEIIIWGHAETSTELLHVFAWREGSYALLGGFEGEAGVRLEDADGDLADEIAVRYDAGSGLVWEAVHTWDGANYGWTWERYDWFYLDRPHAYRTDTPKHAVISFYLAIDDRDISGAYSLLSDSAQVSQPYEVWAVGFVTTVAVEVGVVHEIERSEDSATVAAQALSYDNVDGRIVARLWDVKWSVVQSSNGWRLGGAATELLDSWEAPYY